MKKTINIGCGNRCYTFYPSKEYKCTNVDIRQNLSKVDIICDVTNLKFFSNKEFDYMLASDILEHFPISKTFSILTEWCRVLKEGGLLEIRVPNLETICKNYKKGDAQHTSWLLYGGQDYSENFHYVCFDKFWLTSLLEQIKMNVISYTEEGNNFVILAKRSI